MEKHPDLTRQRLQLFASESYLKGAIYQDRAPVRLSVFPAPGRIPFQEAVSGQYHPAQVGEQFGPLWSTHWFRVQIQIPIEWKGHEVHFLWDSTSEACIYQDGVALQGLTGSTPGSIRVDAIRKEFRLTRFALGGEEVLLWVEIACNNLFGLEGGPLVTSQIGLLRQAEIAVFNREAWDLYWDFKIISDMAIYLQANTPRAGEALFAANRMVNIIDLDDRRTWSPARKEAAEFLAVENSPSQHNLSAIGHAHIDTAWLWPLAETRRKCIRTFSTAIRYMEDYPDYKFACSQAQQYEWVKQMQPELYAKIKAQVQAGRFIPAGGTWVEMDCNIPSGESFIRQFLFGERFFRKEFGITCHEFWEPDVFGYSAALPQIMQGCGIHYFLTQKLSVNQFNKLPDHTFYWEGLDGSRVLTHFPPADTYNSTASVKDVLYDLSNFKNHDRSKESYLLFGFGDGGGGPTPGMLEQIKRMADVDGLPRVQIRSPEEFFYRCTAEERGFSTWVGELYFEQHRGTYTTQAWNKRYNRQCEFLLHDVEMLACLAHANDHSFVYPAMPLDELWKILLTNQFHDIIPGSSITEVYQESIEQYHQVLEQSKLLKQEAVNGLIGKPTEAASRLAVVNTLGFSRTEVAALPPRSSSQQVTDNGITLGVVSAPSAGYCITDACLDVASKAYLTEDPKCFTLENDFIRAIIGCNGRLVSFFDKRARRETIATGESGNRLVLFDDVSKYEAWDVEAFHLEKQNDVSNAVNARPVESGPLRVAVEFTYNLGRSSHLRQMISLTALSPRLDFDTWVDWHESRKFLKVEFPFNLRCQNATYETQFGHLQRPTNFNTSWDLARFEVCAHRWADLSEPDYGVALLNDCKYGYATHRNVMSLSLLRSTKMPDPLADMGQHQFRYALFPHSGSLQQGGVIEEGYAFNHPLDVFPSSSELSEASFFRIDQPHVIIETVKKAEDSNALIVRLYEAYGSRGRVKLSSSLPVSSITRCNLLEEDDISLVWSENSVDFEVTPFQIITFKLLLQEKKR